MAISDLDLPTGVMAHSLADTSRLAEALASTVAEALDFAVQTEGVASLLVSGGRSPVPFFEALSIRPLDWSRVKISLVDERWVPVDHDDSNENLLRRHLLRNEAAKAEFVSLYYPASSLEAAAKQAGQAVSVLKRPIDVLVLGMGEDGHTASLFPGNALLEQALDPDCPDLCMPMVAPVEPRQRISMTYPLLASARLQCLAIHGQGKLKALNQALRANPLQMPIRAFLNYPLEIYWCP
ncbi:6-phosphogluconolactonase [Azomonas macrocytogenes]|uniref:6-phosphogluconolactonase n=1 Tax=Azomonas macrocytogenes TaxID=69962 RepID=A0A839T3C8_AZOMA|nr:6-phosphogluconolactonase [Azomonas macrocytogenes]MBB3103608.1 6-phosphogluconolactonase [Azomonas macrocytogenes]